MTLKLTTKIMPTTAPNNMKWRLKPPSQTRSKPKLKPLRTTPMEKVTSGKKMPEDPNLCTTCYIFGYSRPADRMCPSCKVSERPVGQMRCQKCVLELP